LRRHFVQPLQSNGFARQIVVKHKRYRFSIGPLPGFREEYSGKLCRRHVRDRILLGNYNGHVVGKTLGSNRKNKHNNCAGLHVQNLISETAGSFKLTDHRQEQEVPSVSRIVKRWLTADELIHWSDRRL
jgi:hypothetical protein